MSNVSDSIKIASDFLDAANLAETRDLVAEFRSHRIATRTGDDVLQFYNTLWHCWCSLSEKEDKVHSRAIRVRPAHPQHPPMYHGYNSHPMTECSSSTDLDVPCFASLGDSLPEPSFVPTQTTHVAENLRSQAQGQQDSPLPENNSTQASTRTSRLNGKRKEKRRLRVLGLWTPAPQNLNCSCPLCPRQFTRAGLIHHL